MLREPHRHQGILRVGLIVMLLVSCGGDPPNLAEIEGEQFNNVGEFQESLSCRKQFTVFPHFTEPVNIDSETQAIELAESITDASTRDVDRVVRAGEVWLLVDSDGVAFAAMDSVGGSVGGCVDS